MTQHPKVAMHGGAFWDSFDPTFQEPRQFAVAGDVLDAWFDLPPALLQGLITELPFLLRVSPPTHATGLESMIAQNRGLDPRSVIACDGSSRLIHLILQRNLRNNDRILLLEPTYSEYRFVAEAVGAEVHQHILAAEEAFAWAPQRWLKQVEEIRPTLAVLVRPNNPTGTLIELADWLDHLPEETTLVVDEAYLEYTSLKTMEPLAAQRRNIVVIKSLSKVFGLSGVRLAYAVTHPDSAGSLRAHLPPWTVSGPAQWLGCHVWDHQRYFHERRTRTHEMRASLVQELSQLPGRILAECANWALWEHGGKSSNTSLLESLAKRHVYVRDASMTSNTLSNRTIRVAVRPEDEQNTLIASLRGHLANEDERDHSISARIKL